MMVNQSTIEELARQLLIALGEDLDRDGLVGTPERFARMWAEFIDYDPGRIETAFDVIESGQMIIVEGMRVWSMCEHHLLPFWCDISIGYIAKSNVLGLSKFARIAHKHAHSLQIQERLINGIADDLVQITESDDVIVLGSGEHLCMTMRGIRTPALMKSLSTKGRFHSDAALRDEFFSLLGQ